MNFRNLIVAVIIIVNIPFFSQQSYLFEDNQLNIEVSKNIGSKIITPDLIPEWNKINKEFNIIKFDQLFQKTNNLTLSRFIRLTFEKGTDINEASKKLLTIHDIIRVEKVPIYSPLLPQMILDQILVMKIIHHHHFGWLQINVS